MAWKLETGNWKLEIGNWKFGNWKFVCGTIFQFPLSNMTKPKELVHGDVPRK
jgi:hypothetical protein